MPIPPHRFGRYEPTERQLRKIVGLALLWLLAYGLIALHGIQQRRNIQMIQRAKVLAPYRDVVFLKHARVAQP